VSPLFLALLTFLAVVCAIVAGYSILTDLFLSDRSRLIKRVDEEFSSEQRRKAKKSPLFKDLSAGVTGAEAEENEKRSLAEWFKTLVEQSGLNLTPRYLLLWMAGAASLCFAVIALFRLEPLVILLPAATLAGGSVPLIYVSLKRRARLDKMIAQLPDAFDLMARVIRSGQTMSQAILAVKDEFDPPLAGEFAYCYEQQNLGLSPELALRDLARRTGLLEVKIFVLAMLVQQQTGGNVAELLEKLAGLIRERFRVRGKVRALTAEGRIQAIVLLALPPAMFLLILWLNRGYAEILLDHPWILVAILASEALGALWIRKIVNFEF
jgi:tight adherence protein B